MVFRGFFRFVDSMQVVAMGEMGVISGLFMFTACVVFGRFSMMAGRLFVVLRRSFMMFCASLAHRFLWGDKVEVETNKKMPAGA